MSQVKAYMSHLGGSEGQAAHPERAFAGIDLEALALSEARAILAVSEGAEGILRYQHPSTLSLYGWDYPGDASSALAESLAAFVGEC